MAVALERIDKKISVEKVKRPARKKKRKRKRKKTVGDAEVLDDSDFVGGD
ncbi:hypothetical protein ACFL2W_01110 [Candidatus Omnitrophota bacterium]